MKKNDVFRLLAVVTLSVALFSGCATTDANKKGDSKEYQPPCEQNSIRSGNFFIGTKYSTQVIFPRVSRDQVFNAALAALSGQGDIISSTDWANGYISGYGRVVNDAERVPVLIGVGSEKNCVTVSIRISYGIGLLGNAEDTMCSIVAAIEQQLHVKAQAFIPSDTESGVASKPIPAPAQPAHKPQSQANITQKSLGPEASSVDQDTLFVSTTTANVRQLPSAHSPVVARLRRGDSVKLIKADAHWLLVKTTNGSIGWMYKSLLK